VSGLIVAAVAVTFLVGQSAGAAPAADGDWRQPGGNAAHSRFVAAETSITASSASSLRYVRSYVTPPPQGDCKRSAAEPAVVGNRMYLAAAATAVDAYNLTSGRRLWTIPNPAPDRYYYRSLVVSDRRLFVSMGDCWSESGPHADVEAYNAKTGQHLWSIHNDPQATIVTHGNHLLMAGGSEGDGGYVKSVDPATGQVRWAHDTGCAQSPQVVVVAGRLIADGCASGTQFDRVVRAYALTDGHLIWSRPDLRGGLQLGDFPSSSGSAVYENLGDFRGTNALVSINPRTGATRWSVTGDIVPKAVDANRVYASCSGVRCALDKVTGNVAWTATDGSGDANVVVLPDALLTADGRVVDPATGDVLDYTSLLYADSLDVLVANGWLIAVSDDHRIVDTYRVPRV
jgi:glucose dehydrogenase